MNLSWNTPTTPFKVTRREPCRNEPEFYFFQISAITPYHRPWSGLLTMKVSCFLETPRQVPIKCIWQISLLKTSKRFLQKPLRADKYINFTPFKVTQREPWRNVPEFYLFQISIITPYPRPWSGLPTMEVSYFLETPRQVPIKPGLNAI